MYPYMIILCKCLDVLQLLKYLDFSRINVLEKCLFNLWLLVRETDVLTAIW